MCLCYFQSLKFILLYLEVGSLQRETGTPGSFWGRTPFYVLPARSAPGHSSLGIRTSRAPGMWHRKSLCPEGNRVGISFLFYLFSSHHLNWSIQVNYNLMSVLFFLFLLQHIVSLLHSCIYDLLGFFLYRLIQSVEYVSFCYMVGPGLLFYQ